MSKLYYTSIDMQQNEILNAVMHNSATAPTSPVEGQTYWNTTDNKGYVYNGTAWEAMIGSTLTVHPNSQSFVSIVNDELSIQNLAITTVTVDTTYVDLTAFVAAEYVLGTEFQEGDMIILTNATNQSERSWIHNGGVAGNINDFTRLQTDLNATDVRALFAGGDGITYDNTTGTFSVSTDGITKDMINSDVAGVGLIQNVDGSLEVNVDGTSIIKTGDLIKVQQSYVANNLQGDGLAYNGTTEKIDVNVDGTTLEVSSDAVQVKDGGITQTKLEATLEGKIVNAYKTLIGDGTTTSFNITHGLGSEDIFCSAWKVDTKEHVECMITIVDANTVTFGAFPAPSANNIKVLIQKAILS